MVLSHYAIPSPIVIPMDKMDANEWGMSTALSDRMGYEFQSFHLGVVVGVWIGVRIGYCEKESMSSVTMTKVSLCYGVFILTETEK